ncbi:MAG: spermidine/putrescine transport system ATP-binding protein [Actinomycetota bacterium]|nr:spermidine/putrescine transport system ATP-binding protein [Actinomycetota bacterium]
MITERKSTQKSTRKSTQTGSSLSLRGITKRFGSLLAVDDLSVTIPKGSFFALLGPSGCGKTTTLRMVAGLEEPDSGEIRLSGLDITHTRPHKRPVNTVFQSYALFPHLDIFENVAFGLRRRGHKKVQSAVMDALNLVELPHLARRRPGQLSGGQQQRIALARAIVNQPQVLLLDEPMGALDLKLRRQMQLELKRIQTEVGITFLHVTHDQEEAMTMADTVAVMNRGRIEQLGTPTDLYESPATTFVANFLGQSNLLPGLRAGDLGRDLMVDVHGNKLRVPRSRVRSQDNALLVGVRPEKIRLCATAEFIPENCNRLTGGVVLDVSFAGVSTQYVVRMPWRQDLTVFSQNLGVGERFPAGSTVTVAWEPEHTFGLPRDPIGDGPNHARADSRGS